MRPGGSPRGGGAVRSSGQVAVRGRATYGYHGHHHGRYGYRWGWYAGWGWPYYGYYGYGGYWPYGYYGYYGYPYGYGYAGSYAPGPATVETDVSPRSATVRLDGEDVGQAKDYDGRWDRLGVEPGRHTLEFESPGHQTLRVELATRPGRFYRIAYELREGEGIDTRSETAAPAPQEEPAEGPPTEAPPTFEAEVGSADRPAGFLKMRVRPDDAVVYLDGKFLGRADEVTGLHGAVPVPEGKHRIEVVRPGFATRVVEVEVEVGRAANVTVDLAQVGDL
jgi:hypothetical protein